MSMKLSKDIVGNIIWGYPTGNNAPRRGEVKPVEFEVMSVGRKYFKLRRLEFRSETNYCPETGATQQVINSGYTSNAGYVFFETKDELSQWLEKRALARKIKGLFYNYQYGSLEKHFSFEELKKLEEILEG